MLQRYTSHNCECWEDIVNRCVSYVGTPGIKQYMLDKKFIPAGRILKNSGTSKPMLLNCAVLGSGDSREEIGQTLKEMLIVAGTGCGVGISGRFWRPHGAEISSGGRSSGSMSWFRTLNQLGEAIGEGHDRRVALLFSQAIWHPDIEEFIEAKIEDHELSMANISVELTNSFIDAVRKKQKWNLTWNKKVFKQVWAVDLWNKIIEAACTRGEPGILNLDVANKYSNSNYIAPLVTTNPCVTGDTWVHTKDGIKQVFDLIDKPCDIYFEGKCYPTEGFFETGYKDTVTIFTANRSLTLTLDHRLKVRINRNTGWVRTKHIQAGNLLKTEDGYEEVTVIVPAGIQEVFDIQVPEVHAFYANGIVAHNCGEEFLADGDVCCLGSISLDKFISNSTFDYQEFARVVKEATVFLDAVLDVNLYALKRMEILAARLRRIGLGMMGYHTALLKMGMEYESDEALAFLIKVADMRRCVAYQTSVELAKEKGPFPAFDPGKYLQSKFVQNLPIELQGAICRHGIRNVACLTQAPTGTTSLLAECSSNIEPLFAPAYRVRYRKGDEWLWKNVYDPVFVEYVLQDKDLSIFCNATNIGVKHQLEIQRLMVDYVDAGCSKTINLHPKTSMSDIDSLLLEYADRIKGVTIYPIGSREDEPLKELPISEEVIKDIKENYVETGTTRNCRSGVCDVPLL